MSRIQLTTEEYRRLVNIMANMRAWQSIEHRQANMNLAGLEHFRKDVNFDQDARIFSSNLVERLRHYGDNALMSLISYLTELVGEGEDRTFLQNLLGEYAQPPKARIVHQGTHTILFLSANPQRDLNLDREMRLVGDTLAMAHCRDKFKLEKQTDLQLGDLQAQLMRFQPHIVHFSGHGDGNGSIVVMEDRRPVSVPLKALGDLFAILRDNVRLVVLNSCFSQPLAEQIAQVIDCVVGTNEAIGDGAAIEFARAFYGGLANGKSVHTAFSLGVNALDLRNYADRDVPRLLTRNGVDATRVFFC